MALTFPTYHVVILFSRYKVTFPAFYASTDNEVNCFTRDLLKSLLEKDADIEDCIYQIGCHSDITTSKEISSPVVTFSKNLT